MKMNNKSGFNYTSPFPPSKHAHIPFPALLQTQVSFSHQLSSHTCMHLYAHIYSQPQPTESV